MRLLHHPTTSCFAPLRFTQRSAADEVGGRPHSVGVARGGGVTDYRSKSYNDAKKKDQPSSSSSGSSSGDKRS